ncbi:ribonuclease S-2 [Coffea arabica]|uniref:Putative S-RNase n=1 Tax=Coffea arabica TaxID=13443 RepID=H1ZS27_COFAR|nr:ribonuclease S-2-like [Coffea arabica]CBD77408.1 putative S-RNase [Coffea arabica]
MAGSNCLTRSYLTLTLALLIIDAQKISGQYEFFRLVSFWGPSRCSLNPCKRTPPVPKFTLHGLWPDNYTQPLYNCGGTRYIPLKDQRSINARDNYWYDYFLSKPPSAKGNWRIEQNFWAMEWNRHGTCSENVFNQQNYFNLAKTLMFTYDLTYIFFNARSPIQLPWPRVRDVMLAISKFTQARPELRCRYYNNNKILMEVVLCYDVLGKRVINCTRPGNVFCGRRSSRIYLPTNF